MKKVCILIVLFLVSIYIFCEEKEFTEDQLNKLNDKLQTIIKNKDIDSIYNILFKDNLFKIVDYEFSYDSLDNYRFLTGVILGFLEHSKEKYPYIFENKEINDLFKFLNDVKYYHKNKEEDPELAMKLKLLLSERSGKLKGKYPDSEFIGNLFLLLD